MVESIRVFWLLKYTYFYTVTLPYVITLDVIGYSHLTYMCSLNMPMYWNYCPWNNHILFNWDPAKVSWHHYFTLITQRVIKLPAVGTSTVSLWVSQPFICRPETGSHSGFRTFCGLLYLFFHTAQSWQLSCVTEERWYSNDEHFFLWLLKHFVYSWSLIQINGAEVKRNKMKCKNSLGISKLCFETLFGYEEEMITWPH